MKVAMAALVASWSRLSLSSRILAGLGAGVLTGLFFGEAAAALQPLADIYIRLMQMPVLPYLVTSLVIALGQLEMAEAKRLAWRGGALLLLVWLTACLVIVALPLSFPDYQSASFYSDALIQPATPFSLTDLYFPRNFFDSLARNVVPAVVLFSCLMGIGLIGFRDREALLAPLRVWNAAIVRITLFVIDLTPIGVFAIGAVAAGTLQPETAGKLEVYFIAFTAGSLLLAFWILPLLVTAVTPFHYREVSGIARDALLTAFIANSAFIVLPLLIERSKQLLARHQLLDKETNSATEVLIPIMFNFPNAGKLLTLLFVPFAAWLSGTPLGAVDYGQLFTVGIPSYFAKAQVALPFLLDVFGLPHDLFQLYLPTTIITGKFDSLVTAVNLIVVALLGAAASGDFLVFERARLLRAVVAIVGGTLLLTLAIRLLLVALVDTSYTLDQAVRHMHKSELASDTVVHRELPPAAEQTESTLSAWERITRRGSLRIGFDPDNLPMSFFNAGGELVGFDVELAQQLAQALQLRAEFVPVRWPEVPRLLADGIIDVMPGVWYRPYWFSTVRLSNPYFIGTVGLAVRDERRQEFTSMAALRERRGLKIGVPLDASQIRTAMERYFGGSDTEFVVVEFWQPFFEGRHPEVDAFLMPAENASGWSLLHPRYTVVVPQPDPVHIPSAFGMARDAGELVDMINEWVIFADSAGLIEERHRYWVKGEGMTETAPRWSILRNVLGWGD
ncbi:MAG: cation:dicarboxylase symporter family transporter [Pseudomonadales bacterium]|nr:cation:dicarboxylase symporter family transporter [Pseudomonadales bacterium]